MDKVIKQTIDARKQAIFNSYEVTDKKMLSKIEDLFKKINDFGEKYDDVNKFEADFSTNSLNTEYTNIFVELAKKDINASKPGVGEVVADRVGSELRSRAGLTRAAATNARDNALRDIPVVGNIMDLGNKIDLLKKFRKNK